MMPVDRVESKFFVGREKELAQFRKLLVSESKVNILNIHTNGDGGIGKTQLLLRMQEYCASVSDDVVFAKELIDFYHTESRSRLGLMYQIVNSLGIDYFPEFGKLVKQYQETTDVSRREGLLPQIEEAFKKDYAAFALKLETEKKCIVIFFDTYEFIQRVDEVRKQAESTEFSRWIETQLFPQIVGNTRLIVSGRYSLKEINRSTLSVEEVNLSHFEISDTIAFWKKCFNVETDSELAKEMGSEAFIKTFHTLADGRPILLALFADWVNYDRNPLTPGDLLDEIEQRTEKITETVTEGQKQFFEKALIERIAALIKPEDQVVTYMAVAYRRMTPEMFHFLTKIPIEASFKLTEQSFIGLSKEGVPEGILAKLEDLKNQEYMLEEDFLNALEKTIGEDQTVHYRSLILEHAILDGCRRVLLKKLKPLSFVKYKKGDVVLLHDEMRRLIIEHWWKEQDPVRSERKDITRSLVNYYDKELLANKELSLTDQETYTPELLEYALFTNLEDGLDRFRHEFDVALEDGRYDYYELLLFELEKYYRENQNDIPFPHFLEIDRRQIQYSTEVDGDYERSLQMANAILEKYAAYPTWEHSVLRGHFLMERGIAEFSLENFKASIDSFQKAHDVFFYKAPDDVSLHWAHNWIGYAYYRQGWFAEAEKYLTQSRDGFYRLLVEQSEPSERKRRRLLQGIQITFGNLTAVYNYTGQFDKAIRNAEIALDIVRRLPRNTLEIARVRATTGRAFVYAGRAIDARHHFAEAEKLLQEARSRAILGRVKKDLGILQYRIAELSHILEYYRAEDIEKIIVEKKYVQDQDVEVARTFITEAIETLREEPAIKKELADAYYALGELYMVTQSEDHWEQSEQAFMESLKWGQKSRFRYIVADTLESLVTLYYFWNGASGVTSKVKIENQKKMKQYQKELEELKKFDETMYPKIFGKYHITCGDIKFDEALNELHFGDSGNIETAMTILKEAFTHYVTAIRLMKEFHENHYYLSLCVFYDRLGVLMNEAQEGKITLRVEEQLDELRSLWERESEDIETVYQYVHLRTQSKDQLEQEANELKKTVKEVLDKGNFGWALLLNDCLIGLYRKLLSLYPENDIYKEQLIFRLRSKSNFYRRLGDEYQAMRYLQVARDEFTNLSKTFPKKHVEGALDSAECTLKYRRAEYGQLLEFYLQDELKIARKKFDAQFPGVHENALNTLLEGEKKVNEAISFVKELLAKERDIEKKAYLEKQKLLYYTNLGEIKFRIGELLMLDEKFSDSKYQKRVFDYLQEAIVDCKIGGDIYRHDDALQSYVNALYFSGNYDNPNYYKERIACEEQLEEKFKSGAKYNPSIMGKLRIVQGAALFSSCFQRQEDLTGESKEYRYITRESSPDVRVLRAMLRYYVEACNFMAQHSSLDFAATVRVLKRRIELISDKAALQEILHSLPHIWTDQEHLKEETEELETLSQFAKIRSIMVEEYEDIK